MGRVTERRKGSDIRDGAHWPVSDTPPVRVGPEILASLPDRLRADQRVFDRTGGLHAAALFTETGLTLVGFLRGHNMNVYAGEHRLTLETATAAQG
jgi:formate dehydrogenase assembly factor FdhD